jgi:hypothetical protein
VAVVGVGHKIPVVDLPEVLAVLMAAVVVVVGRHNIAQAVLAVLAVLAV